MGNSRSMSFDSSFRANSQGIFVPGSLASSPAVMKRKKKFHSYDGDAPVGTRENDPWGWFEDFESPNFFYHRGYSSSSNIPGIEHEYTREFTKQPLHKALSLPPPVTEPPSYILESSLKTQQLWYSTAGRRPRQPDREREYFEQLWRKNFEVSNVNYKDHVDVVPETSGENNMAPKKPRLKNKDIIHVSEFDGDVLYRGRSPFSHSVSKSFMTDHHHVSSMTIHIPSYRIFRSSSSSALRAEFLVVVSLGSPSTVTFGVWRRHSDFANLVSLLKDLNTKSGSENAFKNTVLSWDCVIQRKKWFKCLDTDYLSLKSFLLERFMHDLLFESQSPGIISDFLGLEEE